MQQVPATAPVEKRPIVLTEPRPDVRSQSLALAENVTLWTVLAGASLFTAGEISHAYEMNALGIHSLRIEAQWQDRVFHGGFALLDTLLQTLERPNLQRLPWVVSTIFLAAFLRLRRRSAGRRRAAFSGLSVCAYLTTLMLASITAGSTRAEFIRSDGATTEHFVFARDTLDRLPPALLRDNDQRKLKLVVTTPDFVVLLGADGKTTYRVATRNVESQETARR